MQVSKHRISRFCFPFFSWKIPRVALGCWFRTNFCPGRSRVAFGFKFGAKFCSGSARVGFSRVSEAGCGDPPYTPVSVPRWKPSPVDPGEPRLSPVSFSSPGWAPREPRWIFYFNLDPGENPVRGGPPGSTPVNFCYIVNPGENFMHRNHPGNFLSSTMRRLI